MIGEEDNYNSSTDSYFAYLANTKDQNERLKELAITEELGFSSEHLPIKPRSNYTRGFLKIQKHEEKDYERATKLSVGQLLDLADEDKLKKPSRPKNRPLKALPSWKKKSTA